MPGSRILYLGSGAFGIPSLAHLAIHHDVGGVVTQPDRPAGRGGRTTPTPIAQWAQHNLPDTPLIKTPSASEPEQARRIRELAGPGKADAWVVIAFGQILRKNLLEGVFSFNVHASLLPRWRGAAPISAAIMAGDEKTGNSIITIVPRLDAGDVLARSERAIEPTHTTADLHDILAADATPLVERTLRQAAENSLDPRPQDESLVTLAPKLSRSDAWVDFARDADECRRRIHALNPWPAVTVLHREHPLKLLRAQSRSADPQQTGGGQPGTIFDADRGEVDCAPGTVLRLVEVQPAGRKAMTWADYARGRRVRSGETLLGGPPKC